MDNDLDLVTNEHRPPSPLLLLASEGQDDTLKHLQQSNNNDVCAPAPLMTNATVETTSQYAQPPPLDGYNYQLQLTPPNLPPLSEVPPPYQQQPQQQMNPIHNQQLHSLNTPNLNNEQHSLGHNPPYNYCSPPALAVQEHYYQDQHPKYQQQHQLYPHSSQQRHQYQMSSSNFNTDRTTYLLSLPTDSQSLSDRQCYIRSNFIELFIATEQDVESRPAKGSQKIHVGQIGLRCAYCMDNNSTKDRKQQAPPRAERAVCYPQSISRIYQTVADMQRRHFEKCRRIPIQVVGTYKSLKTTRPRGKGNPQAYWESSAREIGLMDSGTMGMGIRVMEGSDGGMVEQFLLQRKNVKGLAGSGGGRVVEEGCSSIGVDAAAAKDEVIDYETKPPSKRRKVSSYSDAHLLASMRDGASPSFPIVDTAGAVHHDVDNG